MAVLDVDIPHFTYPFNFISSFGAVTAAVVEQDSLDDITDCVTVAILTSLGQRVVHPDFGITDPTFELQPLNREQMVSEVLTSEPRAELLVIDQPDDLDQLIDHVRVTVSQREGNA